MTPRTAAAAALHYQSMDLHANVEDASPHRLIQMMMEGALTKISRARGSMEQDEIASKGSNIGDAIQIIEGLQASLNHSADERMSENFDALYTYMMRRLLEANLRNDASILDEVVALMRELKEAWDAIADDV